MRDRERAIEVVKAAMMDGGPWWLDDPLELEERAERIIDAYEALPDTPGDCGLTREEVEARGQGSRVWIDDELMIVTAGASTAMAASRAAPPHSRPLRLIRRLIRG